MSATRRSFATGLATLAGAWLAAACFLAPPDPDAYAGGRAEPEVRAGGPRWLFVVGGGHTAFGDPPQRDVWRGEIASDGTVGPWRAMNPFPGDGRRSAAGAFVNGTFVVTGGKDARTSVLSARVLPGGLLSEWTGSALGGAGLYDHGAGAVGRDTVLLVGNDEAKPETRAGAIGALDRWSDQAPLRVARERPAVVGAGDWVYALGGEAAGDVVVEAVERARVSGGGASEWIASRALPCPLQAMGVASDGRSLFVVGGEGADGATAHAVYASRVGAEGELAPWHPTAELPSEGRAGVAAVVVGRWLYALGGYARAGGGTVTVSDAIVRFEILDAGGLGPAREAGRLPDRRAFAIAGAY
jgi:hypothetical protein